ncbi:hypothetical protein MLD52_03440 [Puniceicoccaceae bacterium K14]|nr:hypothetical protein [Puniceicoccaceae bacterium K14]
MSQRISLTRIIAINWYGFNQIIDVDDMTLISGAFGTGKSALLDLMQQVMLGDGWKANRAASGKKSRGRDLVGYCLCDTNYEDNGERHFLRRSGVTIIALEFTKPAQGTQAETRETWGIRIEYANATAQAKKTHFCVPDRIEYGHIQEGDTLFDEERFRTWLRRDFGKDAIFSRQKDYLEEMATARHLYFDSKSFRLTFPKAIAFEQEENIETFIREFILEESPLNVAEVRESLHAYEDVRQRLEEQEHEAGFLREISSCNAAYEGAAKEAAIAEHVQCILKVAQQEQLRDSHDAKVKSLEAQNRTNLETQVELKKRLESLNKRLSEAAASLHGDPEAEKLKSLKEKIEGDRERLLKLREARQTVSQFLQARQRVWVDWLRHGQSLGLEGVTGTLDTAAVEVDQFCDCSELEGLERLQKMPEHFYQISRLTDEYLRPLEKQKDAAGRRLKEIDKDLKRIENKQTPGAFPLFERLRDELGDKIAQLGRLVEVRAEADVWWPVLESLLDVERSTILSANNEIYKRALDTLSTTAPSPDEAILNPNEAGTEKALVPNDSIISKLEVADTGAKARLLSCFGDVVCCDNAEAVNVSGASRALSIDGYFKDGAVRRRLETEGRVLTLGTRGLQRMKERLLEEQTNKQSELDQVTLRLRDVKGWLSLGQERGLISSRKPENTEGIGGISELERTIGTDEETLKLLQTPERLERVELHQELEQERNGVIERQGSLKDRLAGFEIEVAAPREARDKAISRLEELAVKREASRVDLSRRFKGILDTSLAEQQDRYMALANTWVDRYDALHADLKNIYAEGVECRKDRNSERRALKEASNPSGGIRHPHYQDFNIEDEDNLAWDQRLRQLECVELAESRRQAESRQHEWQRRLEEQVLNELKRRADEAETVIRSLRHHMNQPIGNYRYEIRQRRDTVNYGNIWPLMDSGFEGTDPLVEAMQESSIKTAMDELMAAVNAESGAKEKVTRILDYRNYHNYDIVKVPVGYDSEGRQMTKGISLSRSGGNLSGGEGQVPFFISMLAAFRRVYSRSASQSRSMNRLGLVVMDEAFSKLSSDGIADCLTLARSFGLQLILAFPPEKLGVMVDHAQTVIVVQKDEEHDSEGLPVLIENTPIRMTLDDAVEALD